MVAENSSEEEERERKEEERLERIDERNSERALAALERGRYADEIEEMLQARDSQMHAIMLDPTSDIERHDEYAREIYFGSGFLDGDPMVDTS